MTGTTLQQQTPTQVCLPHTCTHTHPPPHTHTCRWTARHAFPFETLLPLLEEDTTFLQSTVSKARVTRVMS